jgi:hypothetical protein
MGVIPLKTLANGFGWCNGEKEPQRIEGNMPPLQGTADGQNAIAVDGTTTGDQALAGVRGTNESGAGVIGESRGTDPNQLGVGVHGKAIGTGVFGESEGWMGVFGTSKSTTGGAGVMGQALGAGVIGDSETWMGVYGTSKSTTGGAGVMGEHTAGGNAGFFKGNVVISADLVVEGDIQLTGADLAEQFEVDGGAVADPGSVVVLARGDAVRPCNQAYDRRVAGIVSGAGTHRPAVILNRRDGAVRCALALTGRVWCKVDAGFGPVVPGDILTTSPTPGHAMRASDHARAFGAVIGKAMGALNSGRGLVQVIVALR